MATLPTTVPLRLKAKLLAVTVGLPLLVLVAMTSCTPNSSRDRASATAGAAGGGGGSAGAGGGAGGDAGSGGSCHPEVCNGRDDDCDGTPDNGLGSISCNGPLCDFTREACVDGHATTCAFSSFENCTDGIDDDCDGLADCEDSDCIDMWRIEAGEYYGADAAQTASGFAIVASPRSGEDVSDTVLWLVDVERRSSVRVRLDEGAGTTLAADWVRPRIVRAPNGFVVAATRYSNSEAGSIRFLVVDESGRARSAATLPGPPTDGAFMSAAVPSSDGAGVLLLVSGVPVDGSFPTGQYYVSFIAWDGTSRTDWLAVPHTDTLFFPRFAADEAGDILLWGQVSGANFDLFFSALSPGNGAGPATPIGAKARSTSSDFIDAAGTFGTGFLLAFTDIEPSVPENGVTVVAFDRTGAVRSKSQPFGQPNAALRFLRVEDVLWLFTSGPANRTLFAPIASDGSLVESATLTRAATPQGILGAAATPTSALTLLFGQGAVFGLGQGTLFGVLDNICVDGLNPNGS